VKTFRIVSLNRSDRKGTPKTPVESIELQAAVGVVGDAHAGPGPRQVSLLAREDIDALAAQGAQVSPGDFAENITTEGLVLHDVPVGTRLELEDVVLEITQKGKRCTKGCAVRERVGDCIMPTRGVFARVIQGGILTRASVGTYDI
jgi:MOSC domain-containing protein YiiM